MDSGYVQQPIGRGCVRFTVIPAPVPRPRGRPWAAAALAACLVIGLAGARGGVVARIVGWTAAAAAAAWVHRSTACWLVSRIERRRLPGGSFVVSADRIEARDADIARGQLRRLFVRNGLGASAVSFMLCAESGGDSKTLAGGMTESTARGLLVDVSRVLNVG